jgi:hypothetical protein
LENKHTYQKVIIVLIGYILFEILAVFTNIGILGYFLYVTAFPYILVKLRVLIAKRYGLRRIGLIVNALLLSIILSVFLSFTIGAVFSMNNMNNNVAALAKLIYVLAMIKGIFYMVLGIYLIQNINRSEKIFFVFNITCLLLGLHPLFLSIIGLIPTLLSIMSHNITMTILNVLKYSMPLLMITLFVTIFCIFMKAKDNENQHTVIM